MDNNIEFSSCTISSHQCKCLEKLTTDEKAALEEKSVRITYKKGEAICKQGSFVSHVIFIQKGLAKVFIDDGQNTLILKIIPEGNILGLSSVSEIHNKYQYSAMAYIDSEVLQVEIQFFRQLVKQNAEFASEILNILSANNLQIYGRFFCLTHKQSYGRLADIILCLSDRIFKADEFELPLSRKELAELTGMSPETVIRMLKKFHTDGLILLEGKQFKVLNYDKLKKISETG